MKKLILILMVGSLFMGCEPCSLAGPNPMCHMNWELQPTCDWPMSYDNCSCECVFSPFGG